MKTKHLETLCVILCVLNIITWVIQIFEPRAILGIIPLTGICFIIWIILMKRGGIFDDNDEE